jgi:hypothetical protein
LVAEDDEEGDSYLFDGITYNLSPMFKEASGHVFRDLEGMTGADAFRILRAALIRLVHEPAKFEAMNPPNGWGDYDGLCCAVLKAAVAAQRRPTAVVEFSG